LKALEMAASDRASGHRPIGRERLLRRTPARDQ
jgi:hypothetical protein